MSQSEQPAKPQNPWGPQADTGKAPKKVVRLPLDTTRDCQRALARLIRRTMAGEVKTEDLSRYSNALMILARLIEGGEIERRLDAIERGLH